MRKVLIATAMLADPNRPFVRVLRDAGFELAYPRERKQLTADELIEALQGASAAIAGSEPYSRRVIESSPQLAIIARNGVGYDAVDVTAANEQGVAVTTTPGANHESVAEHTFALLLAVARSVAAQDAAIRAGRWQRD